MSDFRPALAREIQSLPFEQVVRFWDDYHRKGKLEQRVRVLCLHDLYYLLVKVCGRKDMLNHFAFARCREVEANPDGYLDLWAREHWKDLADDTPMLTANRGWTTHGELKIGDSVFAPSGASVLVRALSDRYTDSQCRRVSFSDGAQIVAGAGHLWGVRQKHRLRQSGSELRKVLWTESVVETRDLPERADIGAIEHPLEFPVQQLLISPYVLGCWLGDGESAAGRICGQDRQIFDLIYQAGYQTSHNHCPQRAPFETRTIYGIRPLLRELRVLNNKHIPAQYMNASVHQRMELLRGLMDTDGDCNTRGTASFSNTNEALARQVWELATGLAMRPRFLSYAKDGIIEYRVVMQAHTDRNPFNLGRKADRAIAPSAHRNCRDVVSVEPVESVPTRCIQVEGDMYLAGRELIPTHNSTIITFGLTIQDILKDPDVTFGIFSHTRPIAKAFLRQVMRELEGNRTLQACFPDVLWGPAIKDAPKWSEDDGIVVRRKANPKESTIEAWGLVDGQPTSKHFNKLLYDDIVVRDTVTSPEMIQKTMEALEASYNLGVTDGGIRRMAGTRWHFNDPYRTVIERGSFKKREHPGREGGTEEGRSVWWSEEIHQQKRRDMGPYTYAAQILLNPKADALQGFKREWLCHYSKLVGTERMNKYLLVDSATSKKKHSDYTAIWVIGLAADGNYYALDFVRDRLNLAERGDRIFAMHRKWKPRETRYERYGLMADVEHLKQRMESENYRFPITEVAGQTSKADRIKRLLPLFEQKRVWLPRSLHITDWQKYTVDLVQTFVEEEYFPFPVGLHDDLLDSLSRIAEPDLRLVWPKEEKIDYSPAPVNYERSQTAWMA